MLSESSGPDIQAKVAFLRRPEAYPEGPRRVEVVETHMSWVFLTERDAYKLKKPVRNEFLDFSTLEARQGDCQAEMRLNRPLAGDVYRELVALTFGERVGLRLGGGGTPVDWLVRMRRLPADRMLDAVIRAGTLDPADVERLVVTLADFYRAAAPAAYRPDDYRRRLLREVRTNARALVAAELPAVQAQRVHAAQLAFLGRECGLLAERVRTGRLVEAHGDLRPEHICLEPKPVVIDRLEFRREFRIMDVAAELAFLAMECERLGAPHVGPRILEIYGDLSGDRPPARLVRFYQAHRASLRAKLALWHVRDVDPVEAETWVLRAQRYLDLAAVYASQC
jgi:aminoglycoside phosphotransferase family enzyme